MNYFKHHLCFVEGLEFNSEREGLVKLDVDIDYRMLDGGPEIEWNNIIIVYSDEEEAKEFKPSDKDYDELEEIFKSRASAHYNNF